MHALSLCFISAACYSAFIVVPTNTENFKFFLNLLLYITHKINFGTNTPILTKEDGISKNSAIKLLK